MPDFLLRNYDSIEQYQRAHDAIRLRVFDVASGAAAELDSSVAVITDANGRIASSPVTATELATLSGISTANPLVTQLAGKADLAGPQIHTGSHTFTSPFIMYEIANSDPGEGSEPAVPAAGYSKLWVCDDGEVHIRQSDGTHNILKADDRYYAEMYIYNNATATTISEASTPIGITLFSDTDASLDGFTFRDGTYGTAAAYEIKDNAGKVTVADTTNIAEGDYVTLYNVSAGTLTADIYRIDSVVLNTSFSFTTSDGDQDVGNTVDFVVPSQLVVSAGSAGLYRIGFNLSAAAAGAQTNSFQICRGWYDDPDYTYTLCTKCVAERKFPVTDIGSVSGQALTTSLTDGDRIFLVTTSDATNNMTFKHGSVILTRI